MQEAKSSNFEKRMEYLEQRLDIELGTLKLTGAYEEGINYPFRAGAVKAVVAIIATPCEKSPLPLSVRIFLFLSPVSILRYARGTSV